jgi:hypothetical protein
MQNIKYKILKEANNLSNKTYDDKSHCNCSAFCSNVLNGAFEEFISYKIMKCFFLILCIK